jgi:SAM-dependent methyltransferase
MKTRESGMPDEERWTSFFNPNEIFDQLELSSSCLAAADLGCGYGTFTIPAARRIAGVIYGFDIEADMVAVCQAKANAAGLSNVQVIQRDFMDHGTGLAEQSLDYVMLFNILHAENPIGLLQETHRILKPGGKVGVIHWNYDPTTPRGPSMAIRPRPDQIREWLTTAGFDIRLPFVDLPPYHYGMIGQKRES